MWNRHYDYYYKQEAPRRPISVTAILLLANGLVFLAELMAPQRTLMHALYTFGLVGGEFRPWALVTSMFMHGGWGHIIGNMWILWMLGTAVESRMGRWRFFTFYMISGLIAGATHLFANWGSDTPTIGASGAIAGVMGAAIVLFPTQRMLMILPIPFPIFVEVPVYLYLGFWFLTQVLSGTASLVRPEATGDIAWFAHIGGFVGGLALHRLFVRPVEVNHLDW
jgi:membrane associated rhomboid family serine protease